MDTAAVVLSEVSTDLGAIGVDVGGTFTDTTVSLRDGRVAEGKALTTKANLVEGVLGSISNAAQSLGLTTEDLLGQVLWVGHGTTVGLNALLTGTGSRVGLLVTDGFEGIFPIARLNWVRAIRQEDRTEMRKWEKPPVLVHRSLITGVRERIDSRGDVLLPLDEAHARAGVRKLKAAGVESLAVCLLWSIANPSHECLVRDIAAEEMPGSFVTISSDISQRIGEYERCVSAVLNSYVGPLFDHYLLDLDGALRENGFRGSLYCLQMSGGVQPAEKLRARPLTCINSGPIGGLSACEQRGRSNGHLEIVATDVGGTSFDVGLVVSGEPEISREPRIGRFEISTPAIDVVSIGTGGGSIAHVDQDLLALVVGPRSAGSMPGPACYGRGGSQPTVTDAALLLGYLGHGGNGVTMSKELAQRAIEVNIAKPLGLSAEEAAEGILKVANFQMAELIRRLTVLRGYDLSRFVIYAYGGAAPQYVGRYAEILGAPLAVVPRLASVFSSFGAAIGDLQTPVVRDLSPVALGSAVSLMEDTFADISSTAIAEFADVIEATGFVPQIVRTAGLRFKRQVHELEIPVPGPGLDDKVIAFIEDQFRQEYERLAGKGTTFSDTIVELVSVSVTVRIPMNEKSAYRPMHVAGEWEPREHERDAIFDGRELKCPVLGVRDLRITDAVSGPAFVELHNTTLVVYPGQSVLLGETGDLMLQMGGRP
ncbi:MAG: hydantoinase/oxoprolinase family protein [Acidimicrobiales bacterium]